MKGETLRKVRKCDPIELLLWVSSCQLPRVNRERAAIIEYAIGVLVSLDYRKRKKKRKTSRELVRRILQESYRDLRDYKQHPDSSPLEIFFPIGFLTIRGEALPWQFAQAALDRYGPHNEWMLSKLGFTIFDAVEFSKGIMKHMMMKGFKLNPPSFPPFTEDQYYDPEYVLVPSRDVLPFWNSAMVFSKTEAELLFPKAQHKRFDRFLERMTTDLNKTQPGVRNPLEYNILAGQPLVSIGDDLVLPLPRLLWYALSVTFHYDLLGDATYRGRYIDEKGKIAEKRMLKCFNKIFPEDRLLPRVKYSRRKGWPDVDLVVQGENTSLLVECTAKWITRPAKRGDLSHIMNDLKTSVEKCSNQLARVYESHLQGKIKEIKTERILPVIVADDYIPGIDYILTLCDILKEPYPYIINIYDLDIITDLMDGNSFIDFVSERIKLSKRRRIFAADEIDYFVLYQTRGFKDFTNKLEKGNSQLYYIGHLENLYPDYYARNLTRFINDPVFTDMVKSRAIDLTTGWS